MTVSASESSNTNTKQRQTYIPPSLRYKNVSSARPTSTKKNEPKKELLLADAFPTLSETIKKCKNNASSNASSISKNKEPISFSSMTSKKASKENKTTTIQMPEQNILPGWVYIQKKNGKIEYKFGEPVISDNQIKLEYQEDRRLGSILFKYRIEREQYERDMDIERLGDLSEFYGEPTLIEIYANDSDLNNHYDQIHSDNEY